VRRNPDLPTVRVDSTEYALRVTEAFPRRPSSPYGMPNREEIELARHDYQHHIPSRVAYHICLAEGCGKWPCRHHQRAVWVLDHAALIDIDGSLRADRVGDVMDGVFGWEEFGESEEHSGH